jgi:tetratricopeptide (TPR) repeat protein
LKVAAERAELDAALGFAERARHRLDSALAERPLEFMAPLDRPYAALAAAFATAGHPERAEALLSERARAIPVHNQPLDAVPVLRARILTRLARADAGSAERLARAGDFGACGGCRDLYLARAFDARGITDSTLATYERYLATTAGRELLDPTELARAYRRLGELHEARGDVRRAVERYGDFVALWTGADAALQPAVADVRERIRRLRERTR